MHENQTLHRHDVLRRGARIRSRSCRRPLRPVRCSAAMAAPVRATRRSSARRWSNGADGGGGRRRRWCARGRGSRSVERRPARPSRRRRRPRATAGARRSQARRLGAGQARGAGRASARRPPTSAQAARGRAIQLVRRAARDRPRAAVGQRWGSPAAISLYMLLALGALLLTGALTGRMAHRPPPVEGKSAKGDATREPE